VGILNLFVRALDTPHLPRKKSSHLHPNRPSDQLSWRTPRRILSMNPVAKATKRCCLHARPTEATTTQSEKESPRPRTQRRPQCTRQHSLMIFPPARPAPLTVSAPSFLTALLASPNKPSVLILLRTLFLSLLSFCRSPRLFSIACGLFLQNTGGGVAPVLPFTSHQPRITNHVSRSPLFLWSYKLFFPQSFLKIICVASGCGVSEPSSLLCDPCAVDGPAA